MLETEKERNGIIIPDSAKEKANKGKVQAVGPGRQLEDGTILPMTVSAGDIVIFQPYSGSAVNIDGQEYLIIQERDILARVTE